MDNKDLFLDAQTNQYGSHMVMTNVHKSTKTKLINIDTQFRDEYNYNDTSSSYSVTLPDRFKYNVTLPDRINSVKTLTVKSIEIPMTFYNISSNLGNNSFSITNKTSNVTTVITVPDENYTMSSFITATNNVLVSGSSSKLTLTQNANGKYQISAVTNNFDINFASFGTTQTNNKYNFKTSLGWLLGFRKPTYTVAASSSVIADSLSLVTTPSSRYLYLAIDEFNKGVQNSFVTSVSNAFLNKNVIARISIDLTTYPFGSVLVANTLNGLLLSDTRNYNGKIDLQKVNIQLLTETGAPVDLNGNDFSFCVEATYE